MRRILLYIFLVVVFFWGFHQLKDSWESNQKSLNATYTDVTGGVVKWYQGATDSTKGLKEQLNTQIQDASDKYNQLKQEIDTVNNTVNVKRDQLDQTLKQMEAAKKSLDQLLQGDKTNTPPATPSN